MSAHDHKLIGLFQLRRSHSGTLYANTSEIERKQCSLVFENGVILVLYKVL